MGSYGQAAGPRRDVLQNGPALILHGTQDATHPVSHARKLHTTVPASSLAEIPDAAHMAHFDNPQAWVAELRSFLAPGT